MNINLVYVLVSACVLFYQYDPNTTLQLDGYMGNYKLMNNAISADTTLYTTYNNISYIVDIRSNVVPTDITLVNREYISPDYNGYFGYVDELPSQPTHLTSTTIATNRAIRDDQPMKLFITVPHSYIHVDNVLGMIIVEDQSWVSRLYIVMLVVAGFILHTYLPSTYVHNGIAYVQQYSSNNTVIDYILTLVSYTLLYVQHMYEQCYDYLQKSYVEFIDHFHLVKY